MTTTHLLLVCITTLAGLLVTHALVKATLANRLACARVDAAARLRAPQQNSAPPRVGHRVTVHTKKPDDQTIFGVVTGDYVDRLVLEDAEYVTKLGGQPLPGRQDIATRDIAWIDVHALVAIPTEAPARQPATIEA